MHRKLLTTLGLSVGAMLLSGCTPDTYQPNATDSDLVFYAGRASYPYDTKSEPAPHLFAEVAPDATITIYNAGDETYADFELWVNQLYTLHVRKLDARSKIKIAPKDLYSVKSASNLVNAPASTISSVQIYIPSTGKLLDVQGPILPH